jgi:hypothetical protein
LGTKKRASVESAQKTEIKKSRWTVSLSLIRNGIYSLAMSLFCKKMC